MYPLPAHMHSLPIINIPHQMVQLFTKDEPVWTPHHHPKFVVYIRVHS